MTNKGIKYAKVVLRYGRPDRDLSKFKFKNVEVDINDTFIKIKVNETKTKIYQTQFVYNLALKE